MDQKVCPICENDLKCGRVAVRKSIGAKLRWPWPSDRLFFKADEGDQRTETVIREGASYEAYKCSGCSAILITRNRWSRDH